MTSSLATTQTPTLNTHPKAKEATIATHYVKAQAVPAVGQLTMSLPQKVEYWDKRAKRDEQRNRNRREVCVALFTLPCYFPLLCKDVKHQKIRSPSPALSGSPTTSTSSSSSSSSSSQKPPNPALAKPTAKASAPEGKEIRRSQSELRTYSLYFSSSQPHSLSSFISAFCCTSFLIFLFLQLLPPPFFLPTLTNGFPASHPLCRLSLQPHSLQL